MENLCNLLFELSNEDRVRILHQLDKKAMNVTRLSKTLGLTTQESSRHLSRLVDAGLTQKDVEGLHRLTPLGGLVLEQTKGLDFISQNLHYFISHSLMHLPRELLCRIGELAGSTYVGEMVSSFHNIDDMIREAEEYIWTISDQYRMSTMPAFTQAYERGVEVRNIEAKDWVNPFTSRQTERWIVSRDRKATRRARTAGILEERMLERLDVYLYMSEKEIAILAFSLPDGVFDYLGFTTRDETPHKWCRDMFEYYWERGRNRYALAEELYGWVKERPKATFALKNIVEGKEALNDGELISELESMCLVKQGKLTVLGDIVNMRLQGRPV